MKFSLDPDDVSSVPAAIALHEAHLPSEWRRGQVSRGIWHDTPVLHHASDGSEGVQVVHLAAIALLQMLEAPRSNADRLRQAETLTFVHLGNRLLRDLANHSRGDPEVPLCGRISQLFSALESKVSGPVFAPERFSYIPAESFEGEHFGAIDCVYAAVFRIAAEKLPLKSLVRELQRVTAWADSLARRESVIQVWSEIPN